MDEAMTNGVEVQEVAEPAETWTEGARSGVQEGLDTGEHPAQEDAAAEQGVKHAAVAEQQAESANASGEQTERQGATAAEWRRTAQGGFVDRASAMEGAPASFASGEAMTDNQRWEIARKRAEREMQSKLEAEKKRNQELVEALNGFGFHGTADEITTAVRAQKAGLSPEEYQRRESERKAELQKAVENAPEVQSARQILRERKFEQDLAAIKKAYPDVNAAGVAELGEHFVALMAAAESAGHPLDPVVAYEAQLAYDRRNAKAPPPSTGPAKGVSAPEEKEYYTSAEVDRLSAEELDNPSVMDKVMKSMQRWKR